MKDFVRNLHPVRYDIENDRHHGGMNITATLIGDGVKVEITGTGNSDLCRKIEQLHRKGQTARLAISWPDSDIDEARRLLGIGQNSAAIAKALDIWERLDK